MPGFFFFVVKRDLLQVFGLEHLIAIQTPNVIDPVPPHEKLSALVLASGHIKLRFPYSNEGRTNVKPLTGSFEPGSFPQFHGSGL